MATTSVPPLLPPPVLLGMIRSAESYRWKPSGNEIQSRMAPPSPRHCFPAELELFPALFPSSSDSLERSRKISSVHMGGKGRDVRWR